MYNALLPAVATTLDLLAGDITRVWGRHASLFATQDAWFVTLRFADETIASIEALSATEPAQGRELLVEVTGSERVLRAEPLRQAVVVERLGSAPAHQPWWEDVAERYLQLVQRRAEEPHGNAGSRLRAVWSAIQRSAEAGEPVRL
jgi:predicted dehydrogenase